MTYEVKSVTDDSQVYRLQPLDKGRRILVACGPGNNGTVEITCC